MAVRVETSTDTLEEVKRSVPDPVVAEEKSEVAVKAESAPAKPAAGTPEGEADKAVNGAESAPAKKEKVQDDDDDENNLPSGVRKTLKKLRSERRGLRERVADLEEKLVTRPTPALVADQEKSFSGRSRPTREEFAKEKDPDAAFTEALTDWKADEKLGKDASERAQADSQAETERAVAEYSGRVPTARERYEDFDEAFDDLADLEEPVDTTPMMQYVMLNSEVGPDIAYYLAKHTDLAVKISRMNNADAIRQMGRVEEKVVAIVEKFEADAKLAKKTPEPVKKTVSKAPVPTTAVGASSQQTKTLKELAGTDERHVDHIKFDKTYEKKRMQERSVR